jgi:hypothetical protein
MSNKYTFSIDYIIEKCGQKYFDDLNAPTNKKERNQFYLNHALELMTKNKTRNQQVNIIINQMIRSSGGYGRITSAGSRWSRNSDNDTDNNSILPISHKIYEGDR